MAQFAVASPFPGCQPQGIGCENEPAIVQIGYLDVNPSYLDPATGFAIRMNKDSGGDVPSTAPFQGVLPLFGCAPDAQFYRVMASYADSSGLVFDSSGSVVPRASRSGRCAPRRRAGRGPGPAGRDARGELPAGPPGLVVEPPLSNDLRHIYDGPTDNSIGGTVTYKISADAANGCYSWTLTAFSRAFTPNDSAGLTDMGGFAWNYTQTWIWSNALTSVGVITTG